jgi:chromosome segregation ATPase
MSKLEEFNNCVTNLQEELSNFQAIKAAYKSLADLARDYEKILADFNSAKSDLSAAKSQMVNELISQHRDLETKLHDFRELLASNSKSLESLLVQKTDELTAENKKFYNDFANTVQTRLDDNKLQIKQLIDQDSSAVRSQIKELKYDVEKKVELVTKQVESLQVQFKQHIDIQKKISLSFGIVITILCVVLIVLAIL